MKQRNIMVCILLSLITCGLYGTHWIIMLNNDANSLSGRQDTSGGTIFPFTLIVCGIYGLFWMHQMGNAMEMLRGQHGELGGSAPVAYLLLGLSGLGIVSYALLQSELNKYFPNT